MKKVLFKKIDRFTHEIKFKWNRIWFLRDGHELATMWHRILSKDMKDCSIPSENNKYILTFIDSSWYSFYANYNQVKYYISQFLNSYYEPEFVEKILEPDIKSSKIILFDINYYDVIMEEISNLESTYMDDNYWKDIHIEDLEEIINNNWNY